MKKLTEYLILIAILICAYPAYGKKSNTRKDFQIPHLVKQGNTTQLIVDVISDFFDGHLHR
jgi:hypothetical protein